MIDGFIVIILAMLGCIGLGVLLGWSFWGRDAKYYKNLAEAYKEKLTSPVCFQDGAKCVDKTMIDKACEWLGKNIIKYINWEYNEFHQCVEFDGSYDIVKMISDFRKAMEE